ncbi:MAG TPA: ribosome maturation factor RimP [Clostridiales bacterium]|nr:ribosome maturation factor RimP [Clostridiales bacterium]
MDITTKVQNAIAKTIEDLGYELVEVTYKYQHKAWQLTVFIHKTEGIALSDCEKVHYAIDGILDELDPTNGAPYNLNVSSLGLDRPMTTDKDYNRNLNKEVEVNLKNPIDKKNVIEGFLKGFDEQSVLVEELKTKKEYKLERDNIKLMTLLIKF